MKWADLFKSLVVAWGLTVGGGLGTDGDDVMHSGKVRAVEANDDVVFSTRIVGGENVIPLNNEELKYPWMVAIQRRYYNGFHQTYCGATVIHPKVLLTAAHCIKGMARLVFNASNTLDMQNRLVKELRNSADYRVHVHPGYSLFPILMHDIALIEFDEPLHPALPSIRVDNLPGYKAGINALAIGWGALREGRSSGPSTLNVVSLKVSSNQKCRGALNTATRKKIFASNLCTITTEGKDTCKGDSGGPLFLDRKKGPIQIGIVSWGVGCARSGSFGVYTRVKFYAPWIRSILRSADRDVSP